MDQFNERPVGFGRQFATNLQKNTKSSRYGPYLYKYKEREQQNTYANTKSNNYLNAIGTSSINQRHDFLFRRNQQDINDTPWQNRNLWDHDLPVNKSNIPYERERHDDNYRTQSKWEERGYSRNDTFSVDSYDLSYRRTERINNYQRQTAYEDVDNCFDRNTNNIQSQNYSSNSRNRTSKNKRYKSSTQSNNTQGKNATITSQNQKSVEKIKPQGQEDKIKNQKNDNIDMRNSKNTNTSIHQSITASSAQEIQVCPSTLASLELLSKHIDSEIKEKEGNNNVQNFSNNLYKINSKSKIKMRKNQVNKKKKIQIGTEQIINNDFHGFNGANSGDFDFTADEFDMQDNHFKIGTWSGSNVNNQNRNVDSLHASLHNDSNAAASSGLEIQICSSASNPMEVQSTSSYNKQRSEMMLSKSTEKSQYYKFKRKRERKLKRAQRALAQQKNEIHSKEQPTNTCIQVNSIHTEIEGNVENIQNSCDEHNQSDWEIVQVFTYRETEIMYNNDPKESGECQPLSSNNETTNIELQKMEGNIESVQNPCSSSSELPPYNESDIVCKNRPEGSIFSALQSGSSNNENINAEIQEKEENIQNSGSSISQEPGIIHDNNLETSTCSSFKSDLLSISNNERVNDIQEKEGNTENVQNSCFGSSQEPPGSTSVPLKSVNVEVQDKERNVENVQNISVQSCSDSSQVPPYSEPGKTHDEEGLIPSPLKSGELQSTSSNNESINIEVQEKEDVDNIQNLCIQPCFSSLQILPCGEPDDNKPEGSICSLESRELQRISSSKGEELEMAQNEENCSDKVLLQRLRKRKKRGKRRQKYKKKQRKQENQARKGLPDDNKPEGSICLSLEFGKLQRVLSSEDEDLEMAQNEGNCSDKVLLQRLLKRKNRGKRRQKYKKKQRKQENQARKGLPDDNKPEGSICLSLEFGKLQRVLSSEDEDLEMAQNEENCSDKVLQRPLKRKMSRKKYKDKKKQRKQENQARKGLPVKPPSDLSNFSLRSVHALKLLSADGTDFLNMLGIATNLKITVIKLINNLYMCTLEGSGEFKLKAKEAVERFRKPMQLAPTNLMGIFSSVNCSKNSVQHILFKLNDLNISWKRTAETLHGKLERIAKEIQIRLVHLQENAFPSPRKYQDCRRTLKILIKEAKTRYIILNSIILVKLFVADARVHMQVLQQWIREGADTEINNSVQESFNYIFKNDVLLNIDYKAVMKMLSNGEQALQVKQNVNYLMATGTAICDVFKWGDKLKTLKRAYANIIINDYSDESVKNLNMQVMALQQLTYNS